MRANNCAAMKIHLINRTKMLHFKLAKISIFQKLSAKMLKLVPAINCNLKVVVPSCSSIYILGLRIYLHSTRTMCIYVVTISTRTI